MATPQQRAARKRRRQAKAARARAGIYQNKQKPMRPVRGPIFRNPQPKPQIVQTGPGNPGNSKTGKLGLSGSVNRSTNRRAQVIEEDEYIGEVTSNGLPFNVVQYAVNPGQSATFPWGARVAVLYEEYDYELLEFYIKREVSEFSGAGSAGKVMMSFDYDANDSAPGTKQQIEDTVPHIDGMPSTPELRLRIDCARIRKNSSKYVRPGAQPANTDLKLYDAGNLNVATQGLSGGAGVLIGELHVKYRVRLSEPVLENSQVFGGVVHFSGTAPTTADGFATAVQQAGAVSPMTGITAAANVITFPSGMPGNYFIQLSFQASTSSTAFTLPHSGGISSLNLFTGTGARDAGPTIVSAASAGSAQAAIVSNTISLTNAGGTITLTGLTLVGGNSMDLFIVALPATILTVVQKEQQEIDDIRRDNEELHARLARLEVMYLKSMAPEPHRYVNTELSSGPESPLEESKEAELERSIHVPRSMFAKLMRQKD